MGFTWVWGNDDRNALFYYLVGLDFGVLIPFVRFVPRCDYVKLCGSVTDEFIILKKWHYDITISIFVVYCGNIVLGL